jgi:hypothetical protein
MEAICRGRDRRHCIPVNGEVAALGHVTCSNRGVTAKTRRANLAHRQPAELPRRRIIAHFNSAILNTTYRRARSRIAIFAVATFSPSNLDEDRG